MILKDAFYFGSNLYDPLIREMPDGKPICDKKDIGLIAQMICDTEGDHLEVGTAYGGTLFAAIKAMEYCNRKGKVVSIEPFGEDIRNTLHKAVEKEFWNNVKHFGYADRIEHIKKNTRPGSEYPIKNRRFATAFIDGDHSFEYVLNDWNNIKNMVDCYIMFHDYRKPAIKDVVDTYAIMDNRWRVGATEGWSVVLENKQWILQKTNSSN